MLNSKENSFPVNGKRCSGALYGACGVNSHGMS